ncbi:nucleoside 2-deoxyribosyltransferase [Bradyrhizobium diazoefficiens]|uniref:nucleoside 2-deoxyribosyltransferase n=1 Tax=Bradyrhizobium diazoefficiens TaxID=1355477 RepID=UPI001B3E5C40|nr:nucleoside 2-deoxyribosyltransferase [Bradyrhizobium japonicum]
MHSRIKIYFAAPLFNDRERSFNSLVAEKLSSFTDVFLPQRDGSLITSMISAGVPHSVAEARVFEQDRKAMTASDLLVAVLDGGHIDEGVAFEIGYMCALGRPCVGLQTDVRRALPFGNNPMIAQGLRDILGDVDALVMWVANFAEQHPFHSLRA